MSQAFNVNLEASLYGSSDEDYSSKNKADIKTVDVCAQPDNTLEDLVIQEEVYEPRKVQSWQRRRKGYYAPRRYESWHGISDKDLEKPTQMEEDDISDTYGLHLHTSVAFEKLGLYFYEPQKLLLVANPNLSKPTSEQKNKLDVKSKLTSETDSVKEISPLDHSIKVFDERFFGFPKESIESKDVVPLDKIGVFETRNLYTTIPNKLSNRTKHKEQSDAKKQLTPGKNDDDAKASTSDNEINKSQFQKLFMKTLNKIYHDALGIPEKRHTTESDLELTTYELEKFERNYMIIFNHENFLSEPKRRGTALDVAALEDTFKQFRFNVTTHNDLKEKDLFTELKKFSRRNFSSSGCLCIAILTHGQDHGYLRAFDTRYCERDVIACFDARINPSLVGKPIIFLIQACRGRQPAAVVESRSQSVQEPVHTVELDAVYPTDKYRRPMDSDIIMFHSSFFGRASIRVVEEGTWFIQTLCEQIRLHGTTDHFEKLCRRVRTIVAHMEYKGAKQMPVVTTTLLKKLYLKKELSNSEFDEIWQKALEKTLALIPPHRRDFERIRSIKVPRQSSLQRFFSQLPED